MARASESPSGWGVAPNSILVLYPGGKAAGRPGQAVTGASRFAMAAVRKARAVNYFVGPHPPLSPGGGFGEVLCFQRLARGGSRQVTDPKEFTPNHPGNRGLSCGAASEAAVSIEHSILALTRSGDAMAVPIPAMPGGRGLLFWCRWIQYSERRENTGKREVVCFVRIVIFFT